MTQTLIARAVCRLGRAACAQLVSPRTCSPPPNPWAGQTAPPNLHQSGRPGVCREHLGQHLVAALPVRCAPYTPPTARPCGDRGTVAYSSAATSSRILPACRLYPDSPEQGNLKKGLRFTMFFHKAQSSGSASRHKRSLRNKCGGLMVKKVIPKLPLKPEPSTIHLYSANDPIPVPDAIESDTDAVWSLWEDSVSPQSSAPDTNFENTVPAELEPAPSANSPKRRP